MSLSVHVDEAALARYQALAERDPAGYRRKVAVAAIAGDVLLTVAQVAPLVLPIAFGVLLYPHPWLIAMAVLALVFFVWIMRPQLRTTGRPLSRDRAPMLFESVDAMCRRL